MKRTRVICVAASVLSPVAASLLRLALDPWLGHYGAYGVLSVPVALGSWCGGLGGGGAALLLSSLLVLCSPADRALLPLLVSSSIPTLLVVQALHRIRLGFQQQSTLLQETLQERDRLISMVAHELRSPLGSMSNAVHLMGALNSAGSDITKPHGIAVRSIQQMNVLIDDLMDVSRLARGRMQLRYQPFDLAEIIDTLLPALTAQAQAKGVGLEVCMPTPVQVFADPSRLSQVFANLIGNAVKFTDQGCVRVTLTANTNNGCLVIEDTGIGIPEEMLPHLFEPFRQGSSADLRGGLGLGLSVVKGLVELHGGTVTVQSEGVGRGSRFTVELPLEETLTQKGEKDARLSARAAGGG